MKIIIKFLILILCVNLSSCNRNDDDAYVCNGDCNIFKGRIYTEDNIGIPNVQISVSYTTSYSLGPNRTRVIAKSKTDSEGFYQIEGYIKDDEFNNGSFRLTIDDNKIENSISNNFLKPSELYEGVYDDNNVYFIPNLINRSQIITTDYKIPYKTNLVVNLNDFYPTTTNDVFGVGNGIKYGFESEYRFLTKQLNNQGFGFSNGVNSTIIVPCVYGENHLRIYKFRNGLNEYIDDIITVTNPNTTLPLNYSY